jgi:hypothetical protein
VTEPSVGGLLRAAADVQGFCVGQSWRFCFIGGLAVQRWGEPRVTRDADLTVITGFGDEGRFVDAILGTFAGRIDDARAFALKRRVVLAQASNGVGVDISLGALPFEERVVERATDFEIDEGIWITTCSAEDLIVLKAFAGRDLDWLDVRGIAIRQGRKLDQELIWSELLPLLDLKETPEDAEKLREILERARRPG